MHEVAEKGPTFLITLWYRDCFWRGRIILHVSEFLQRAVSVEIVRSPDYVPL